MNKEKQSPRPEAESVCANCEQTATLNPHATACKGKDITEILSFQERRVFYYLLNAKHPKSAADIVRALGQCDPRTHIKGLRDKGVPVSDMWCKCKENGRYKRYFINNPLTA